MTGVGPGARHRILLVDDEPPLLKMMGIYLQRRGYSVLTCSTSEQAAERAREEPGGFSVAVIDATIGGLGMEELASEMLSRNASLHVIVASGYPVNMEGLEAAAPGRVYFLHKPFTPEMLAAAVGRMIAPEEEKI